jgi:soluble lytic murein transglycosylase-like protein
MQRVGVVAAAALLAVGLGRGAAAQVLDIAPDGAVTRLNGPAVYSDPAAPPTPILSEAAEARPATQGAVDRASMADQLRSAAEHNGLSPRVVEAVAWRESRFNPRAVSPKGAVGVMQLMPGTARALGVDPRDAGANLEGGAAYLAGLLKTYNGDLTLALAAYNAGPEAVQRYAGVPPFPETKAFVDAILNRLADTVALGSAR